MKYIRANVRGWTEGGAGGKNYDFTMCWPSIPPWNEVVPGFMEVA